MNTKTPIYIKKSQLSWVNRKLKEGWKRFSVIQPAEIVDELKKLQKKLFSEYRNKK
jgi:hypothetical protein